MILGQRAKKHLFRQVKRRGILTYLKLVQGSRRALLGALLALFAFQLMLLALVGTIVCAVLLWDADAQLKLEVLLGVSATFFLVPLAALAYAFSENFWFRASGAERMVTELRREERAG